MDNSSAKNAEISLNNYKMDLTSNVYAKTDSFLLYQILSAYPVLNSSLAANNVVYPLSALTLINALFVLKIGY